MECVLYICLDTLTLKRNLTMPLQGSSGASHPTPPLSVPASLAGSSAARSHSGPTLQPAIHHLPAFANLLLWPGATSFSLTQSSGSQTSADLKDWLKHRQSGFHNQFLILSAWDGPSRFAFLMISQGMLVLLDQGLYLENHAGQSSSTKASLLLGSPP